MEAKKNLEVKRKKLYRYSAIFVSTIFVFAILNSLCLVFWEDFKYFDFSMELYLSLSIYIFFKHWHEQVKYFSEKTFVEPLKTGKGEDAFDLKYCAVLMNFEGKSSVEALRET
mmetsp:Transcript_35691/g.26507  ORF Transcript_35691/g.26507 Transcript_35691/m.26507 type:complete len:113 (+) Transcript_35691:198-536(+)|eukprot:CAMPEP_0202961064 /NCGR_PEP_ID=MMETSP1396-20130829/5157_1 /ASSEMBLY_ACC=CAM_ASM_000872 /TAXON_ID= /ORGANISM="Pseudokeronopsis sp., Strain Brazil" /LENGTH=112 /DNA_ID=CAMNT_0049680657 /DNA_START=273 /DNA_END=611 /DNA_ORIENTATION=+